MKPILVGMNNPISIKAGHELYPLPEGCAGHRLYKMLQQRTGATMRQYVDSFERRNLVCATQYERLAARARAYEMVSELRDSGRTVVLLGNSVRGAFDWVIKNERCRYCGNGPCENCMNTGLNDPNGLPPLLVHPQIIGGVVYRQIPHPSGRNLWYNEPKNVKVVELLMEELYVEYRERTKVAG